MSGRLPPSFALEPASACDFESLAAMRIEAMRESLERIGRFDPARSTERLRAAFDPADTRHVVVDGQRAGFVIARTVDGHRKLEHLYIRPAHQSKGLGSAVLGAIVAEARALGLALHVTALRESRSNDFYSRHGFACVAREGHDVHYRLETAP